MQVCGVCECVNVCLVSMFSNVRVCVMCVEFVIVAWCILVEFACVCVCVRACVRVCVSFCLCFDEIPVLFSPASILEATMMSIEQQKLLFLDLIGCRLFSAN